MPGKNDRAASYFQFSCTAVPRNLLYNFPRPVARRKIAVRVSGIGAQLRFHQAGGLEDFSKIQSRERAQTAKCIGDRQTLRGLAIVFVSNHFRERHAEPRFYPLLRGRQSAILILELFHQAGRKIRLARHGFGLQQVQDAAQIAPGRGGS